MWGALALAVAWAGPPDRQLVYEVHVGSQTVGTRTASIRYETEKGKQVRIIESYTELAGQVGPVQFSWVQRLSAWCGREPCSYHSVIKENGIAREVQGRWDPAGWTITTVDKRRIDTRDVPNQYVDMSTADLMDPGSRYSMFRYDNIKLLSAETGDVWEGAVQPIGEKTLTIGGKEVPVEGVAWMSPEGRTEFWYASDGWLVQYTMRVLGFQVEGVLRDPPPPGVDEFAVPLTRVKVSVSPL